MFVVTYFVLLYLLTYLFDYQPDIAVCPSAIPPLTLLACGHVVIVLTHRDFSHSIGFSGKQKSLDCQRHLPRYFPCAPSSQLRDLSENRFNNISNLKIYH
jgi:hypothetical protein